VMLPSTDYVGSPHVALSPSAAVSIHAVMPPAGGSFLHPALDFGVVKAL
jgi:hypothetical protein